jgi:tryptophan halogenase
MDHALLKTIVIVGGGTSGWMTAAALCKVLQGKYKIVLVESEDIGTVGVGEATIPMIRRFNQVLEIDENEFMRETQGTFKLGIEFVNWGQLGDRYMHGFGVFGQDLWTVGFDQYWQRMYQQGKALDLEAYSINRMAALANKFMPAQHDLGNSPLADIVHAFHFDAGLYARYLRRYSEARGVQRVEGRIVDVLLRAGNGHVESVLLEDGTRVAGDLFVDCSGFRGLLIEEALKTGYEDWTHWLPCDRAVAVPCESAPELLPYTRSTARTAGWQWRIPLQHRTGNGHVYCSRFMGQDEATSILLANLDGRPTADPRPIRFTTGRRQQFWVGNCVAVGLSSGFLEPLESTSIHLIHTAISRIIGYFPHGGFDAADIAVYNAVTQNEYERIRDFLILHYKLTRRDDSAFWNYCRTMPIPEALQMKIDLFAANGRTLRESEDLFTEMSWLQVMVGQGLMPRGYHPFADLRTADEVAGYLQNIEGVIAQCVRVMPTQARFIAEHCAASAA